MIDGKYILDGKKVVKCIDLIQWSEWFKKADRHLAYNIIGDVRVSTVFLGLDHSFGSGEPILFETMVFGGALDQEQKRCSTWDEAVVMHDNMVKRVKEVK